MDNFNDNQNQWAENIDAIENTEKSENTDTEVAKPTIPQAPQNIVTQPVDAAESTPVNETTPYREYVMKTQPQPAEYSVNTTTPKAQSNKMSAGLKAFMIIALTFIGALLVAFIAYISISTPLNNQNISKEYFYSTPEVTVPTEVPTENQSQGSYDPESQTDKDFKGLKLEQKPNKDKDKYGANYTFKALDNAVVGIICYEKDSGYSGDYRVQGTGIILTKDGYIVTNSHIINNSRNSYDIKIVTKDKEEYVAEVVGFDSRTDLAVLKIKADNLPVAAFGDSDQIEITEDVIAIGNPRDMNFQNSVTKGIVSAVDREVSSSNSSKFIQTDAAINPGNSGGPLCNMYGQVIGINTSKISLEDYEGMGFAIPSKTVKRVVDDIIRYSYVQNRVRIGITGTAVYSSEYDIKGIEIGEIDKKGPMANTKAQVGDVIIAVDGTEISSFTEVYNILETHKAGDEIKIKLFRLKDKSKFNVTVTLQADK